MDPNDREARAAGVHRETVDPVQLAEAERSGLAFVHRSRCAICGRQTPHELCTAHADAKTWPADIDVLWDTGVDLEPETCDVIDCADCPSWSRKTSR